MRLAHTISIVVGMLMTPTIAFAETFKWQDSSGRTHYSNEPPENISNFSTVQTDECLTDECKAIQATESAAQEKRHKELREQQIEKDKLRAQQPAKTSPTYVPVVIPAPYPIPYGGTVYNRSGRAGKRHRPKPELYPHGSSSKSRDNNHRNATQESKHGSSIKLQRK